MTHPNISEFEPYYHVTKNYLDLPTRVNILNKRMEVLHDLLDMLNTQADTHHASYLEWIVIWLIVIEVFVDVGWNMIIKDMLGYFQHH